MPVRQKKIKVVETKGDRGAVVLREIYVDGLLQDGPKGQAAVEEFRADGSLLRRMRYVAGERADGARGEPGIEEFDADGIQTYKAYIASSPSRRRPRRRRPLNPETPR